MFEQFITLSKTVFEEGHYEASFHLLQAALQYAQDYNDAEALEEVVKEAAAQANWLDLHQPQHPLARRPANEYSSMGLFHLLVKQAHVLQHLAVSITKLHPST